MQEPNCCIMAVVRCRKELIPAELVPQCGAWRLPMPPAMQQSHVAFIAACSPTENKRVQRHLCEPLTLVRRRPKLCRACPHHAHPPGRLRTVATKRGRRQRHCPCRVGRANRLFYLTALSVLAVFCPAQASAKQPVRSAYMVCWPRAREEAPGRTRGLPSLWAVAFFFLFFFSSFLSDWRIWQIASAGVC